MAYYNDLDPKDPKHQPVQVMKLQPADQLAGEFADQIRNHGQFNAGGLPTELVLNGLRKAVSEAYFSTYARKLVVLIGDMGDHSDEEDQVRQTSRVFRPDSDTPVEFISIQVVNPERSKEAKAFSTQMASLARFLNEGRDENQRALAQNFVLGRDNLSQLISNGYEGIKARAKRMQEQIDLIRGGAKMLANTLDEDFKEIVRKQKNIPGVENLLKTKAGETEPDLQGFNVGYVWRSPKGMESQVRQLRDVVLLNRAEILTLITALKPIDDARKDKDRRKEPTKEAVQKLIVALVGEAKTSQSTSTEATDSKESFATVMHQRLGLDIQSDFLNCPISGSYDLSWQTLEDLAAKIERLKDVLNDKEHEWTVTTIKEDKAEFTTYQKSAVVYDRPRGFTIPGGTTSYYWLDVHDEIP